MTPRFAPWFFPLCRPALALRLGRTVGTLLFLAATGAPAAESALALVARSPAHAATGVNPDTPLRLSFDRDVRLGAAGRIELLRAADGVVVDTLELGVPATRLVGTNPTPYRFLPAIAADRTVTIFPRAGVLAYGQTYHVRIEAGAIVDAAGEPFAGLAEATGWAFTTKPAGPAAGAAALTVAADGGGDFSTVQGAIDHVPAGNRTRVVITVRPGTYHEILYLGSTKPFITLRGEDRARTVIAYPNNNSFNSGNNRAMVSCDASDFILETITLRNTTPRGGSQAEAIRGNGRRTIFSRVHLASFQDTLLWNGSLFVTDSLIEGDVDFMWGGGAAYFQRCELRALNPGYYAQVRNPESGRGFVYADCRLTSAPGVTNVFLARIDPREGVANTWPFSEVVFLNCAMGPHIPRAGWRLDNATSAPRLRFAEYRSTDLDGATLDVSGRLRDSRQLDDATAAQYRDPQYVLGFTPQVPVAIEVAPAALTAAPGGNVRLTVTATGAPAPAYQWLRGGVPLTGATDATLLLAGVSPADSGDYGVRVSNAGGTVVSPAATLSVPRGRFAGTFFGPIGGGPGSCALFVRDNHTAVFLAQGAGRAGVVSVRDFSVDHDGRFRATDGAVVVEGQIDAAGRVTGTAAGADFIATRVAAGGVTAALAGCYFLREADTSRRVELIVGTEGQAFAVSSEGAGAGGLGTMAADGTLAIALLPGGSLAGALRAQVTLRLPFGATMRSTALTAVADAATSRQRLTGLATRARVTGGEGAAIVGFVIAGDAPRPVLVRGVGPGLAALGVGGALEAPRLELFRGAQWIASNTGWSSGGTATSLAAAFASVGLFPLDPAAADSALAITLSPGAYTAQVSGVGGAEGNALVEVYDLAPANLAQRISNLSTRAAAGQGDATLIGGMTVAGAGPKPMLVRGVGPGLAQFGVTGVLARPQLTIYRGSELVARNTNWSLAEGATAIAAAGRQVGAFPLATAGPASEGDAALLLHLAPGNYTAQVAGADGASGVALLEIYELP